MTKFSTDLKELNKVLSWFEELRHPSVPRYDWIQCELALAEGFTNAVSHAHQNIPADVPVEIEVTLYADRIEIRIWDCGRHFDLEAYLNSLDDRQNNPWAGRGRGILILRKIADYLSYTRIDDSGNCLLIVKKYVPVESDRN